MIPTTTDFKDKIHCLLTEADKNKKSSLILNAKIIHGFFKGYPSKKHRIPSCCNAMKSMMQKGDRIIYAPPKGLGSTFQIEYNFPRIKNK